MNEKPIMDAITADASFAIEAAKLISMDLAKTWGIHQSNNQITDMAMIIARSFGGGRDVLVCHWCFSNDRYVGMINGGKCSICGSTLTLRIAANPRHDGT